MKKLTSIIAIMLLSTIGMAQQTASSVEKLSNGEVRVMGMDALGASVMVLYSADLIKIYQERTIQNATTYARFSNGAVVEFGTFEKPMVQSDELFPKDWFVEK
jgi:hypothetical protein